MDLSTIKKNKISVFIMIVGIVLLVVGLALKVPGDKLTTYSFESGKYSHIEEYVGGDAYNYIIGASLVGGHIAGVMCQKAVFISAGVFIFLGGLALFSFVVSNSEIIDDVCTMDVETKKEEISAEIESE